MIIVLSVCEATVGTKPGSHNLAMLTALNRLDGTAPIRLNGSGK